MSGLSQKFLEIFSLLVNKNWPIKSLQNFQVLVQILFSALSKKLWILTDNSLCDFQKWKPSAWLKLTVSLLNISDFIWRKSPTSLLPAFIFKFWQCGKTWTNFLRQSSKLQINIFYMRSLEVAKITFYHKLDFLIYQNITKIQHQAASFSPAV